MTVYEVVSRVSSGISIAGALIISVTFLLFPTLRKPMNRLMFFASVGNVVLYVFYCVGTAGIPAPGASMALCRSQAFFIQMFSTSAMLFTLAMAINVYLIFFRKWSPSELHRLELKYLGTTYGFTFLHSLIFLILDIAPTQAGIYGPANLWCWVSKDYQWIRFTFGYGITWIACLLIAVIYAATGIKILRQNRGLRHGNYALDAPLTVLQVGNPFRPTEQPILCVTEVQVTSSPREPISPCSTIAEDDDKIRQDGDKKDEISVNKQYDMPVDKQDEISVIKQQQPDEISQEQPDLYPISVSKPEPEPHASNEKTQSTHEDPGEDDETLEKPETSATETCGGAKESHSRRLSDERPQEEPQNAVPDPKTCLQLSTRLRPPWKLKKPPKLRDPRAAHARQAAMAYCKMSMLMFISLILVWAPASVNRVYLLVNDDNPSHVLNSLQAALNPCQGFCDCIIYIVMSWPSFKVIFREVTAALRGKGTLRIRTIEFEDDDSDATTLEPTPVSSRAPSFREMP